MATGVVVSNTTPTGPIVDSNGKALFAFTKWMQNVGGIVNANFDPNGNYQGPIGARATINGRATLASIVQYISTGGVVQAQGINFALPYLNKDTDHITDGTGSPLQGGRAAEIALVTNPPVPEASKWVKGFVGGVFTKAQPAFPDIAGTAAPAQIPALSALSGQITDAQLPADGISVTITTAALTPLGSQGSQTFTNGLLTNQVQAT